MRETRGRKRKNNWSNVDLMAKITIQQMLSIKVSTTSLLSRSFILCIIGQQSQVEDRCLLSICTRDDRQIAYVSLHYQRTTEVVFAVKLFFVVSMSQQLSLCSCVLESIINQHALY